MKNIGSLETTIFLLVAAAVDNHVREALDNVAKKKLRWLAMADAAKHMGISRSKFAHCYKTWGLKYSDIDGMKRWADVDLDAFLQAHCVYPNGVRVIEFPTDIRNSTAAA